MSVKVRPFRSGGYEVDIHTVAPDGTRIRERMKSPVGSKEATKRWAAMREAHLAQEHGAGGCRCKINGREEEQQEDERKSWTVERYLRAWIEQRKAEKVSSGDQEEQRLDDHVIPELGKLKMIDVKPKHAHQLVKVLRRTKSRRGGVLAPRTVRQVFFTAKQAFEEAVLEEILPSNPMIVRKGVLPGIEDKDPATRRSSPARRSRC